MATGDDIKRARRTAGLSQAALAKAIGVTQPSIKKIESGETRKSRHKRDIERHLGLPEDPVPHEPPVSLRSLDARLHRVEAMLNEVLEILKK